MLWQRRSFIEPAQSAADAVTKRWLEDSRESVFGFPTFVRFSWGTSKRLLEDAVTVEWQASRRSL